MDTWIYLSQGFAVAMTPENLVIALIGCFVGTIVGLLPGLGADQRRGNLTAAGLCVASACGVSANSAGDGVHWV